MSEPLRVDLGRIVGLSGAARARLAALGKLVVTSQRTRDQHRNLVDAREKLVFPKFPEVAERWCGTHKSAGSSAARRESDSFLEPFNDYPRWGRWRGGRDSNPRPPT